MKRRRPFVPCLTALHRVVAEYYGLHPHHMVCRGRGAELAYARQIAMYLSRTVEKKSLPHIGREFGRDHSTVHFAIRKISQLINDNPAVARDIERLRNIIHAPP